MTALQSMKSWQLVWLWVDEICVRPMKFEWMKSVMEFAVLISELWVNEVNEICGQWNHVIGRGVGKRDHDDSDDAL